MSLKKVNNTYIFQKNEDVEIEVGDIKQPDFKPRMKIKRWNNEVNFSVGLISDHKGTHTKNTDNKYIWDDGHGNKAHFYEKPDKEFEFEIVLGEKPESNVIPLSIETRGLDFFYQPELTQEEIDEGCVRPDNVVGSYAVYHSTMSGDYIGGNNYRAGKFCHIYRPFAMDANGAEVWCDLHIDKDMQITIPQDFLDNATYPIVVDPTFGTDPASPGGAWSSRADDYMVGSLFTSPSDIDTAQSMSAYVKRMVSDVSANFNIKCVIVLHSSLNIITDGVGNESTEITSDSGIWADSEFGTDPSPASSTEYILMEIQGGTSSAHKVAYDTGVSDQGHVDSSNSYSIPQNLGAATHDNNKYSIYCTYTAAAVGGARPSRVFGGPFVGPLGGPI